MITLIFFQWTIGDSWLAVLLSVLLFLAVCSITAYTSYLLVQHRRKGYTLTPASQHPLYALSPYVEKSNPTRWFHTIYVLLPVLLIKSIFISFAKGSGLTQVVAFVILSLAEFLAVLVLRPTPTRGADVLEGFMAFVRLASSACLVAFVQSVGVKPIPRAVVAFIIAVIFSIAIIVLFINFVIDLAKLLVACIRWALLSDDAKAPVVPPSGTKTPIAEKGEDVLGATGRPSSATLAMTAYTHNASSSSAPASKSQNDHRDKDKGARDLVFPSETVESSAASTIVNSPRASTDEGFGARGGGRLGFVPEDRDLIDTIGPLVSRR